MGFIVSAIVISEFVLYLPCAVSLVYNDKINNGQLVAHFKASFNYQLSEA